MSLSLIHICNAAADLYKYYEDNPTQANMQAYLASVVEKKTSTTPDLVEVDADYVTGKDLDAVKAEHPGYTEVAGFEDESYWLLSNGTNFIIVAKNASTENPDVIGQPTTGTDIFELDYSSFYGDVISAFAFKPEAFGNGIEFSHKNAKSLFTMTVKYDSRIVIQLRDQQGRLYPVSGATYQAADNGYVTTMKADASKTFGWYGTDGAGYHAAGSLKDPAIIELDLNVTVSTTGKNADGTPWATDRGDMRFSYTVRHGCLLYTSRRCGRRPRAKSAKACPRPIGRRWRKFRAHACSPWIRFCAMRGSIRRCFGRLTGGWAR